MKLDRLLTLGVPDAALPAETMRRVRLIVAASGIFIAVASVVAGHHAAQGDLHAAAAVCGTLAAVLANLWLLRVTGKPEVCGHVAVGLLFGLVLTATLPAGGFHAASARWFPIVPLAAFLMCGVARGWLWTAVSGGLVAALWHAAQAAGSVAIVDPASGTDLAALVNRLTLMAATAGFASAFVGTQRRAEHELQSAARALEAEVRERRRAEIEAREATQAKSEFLASMSHEIRTPMVGITGMADLLLADALTRSQREWATIIRRSADTLLGLINDILDFSRIEARHMSLDSISFDLRATADDVVEMLAPVARERGLDLAVSCADVPPALLGDPQRVRQVLTNLVGNAVKFTSAGHVLVVLARDPADPAQIRIEVRDTGIGIAPDRLAQIFEPFTQGDSTTARRFGGSGLGLAISKKLIDLMGGRLGVTSTPGEGSTFWVTFPCVVPEPAPLPRMARVSGIRVAVVSDRSTTLRVIAEALCEIGADLVLATADAEDLERLDPTSGPLDVLILDGRTIDPARLTARPAPRILVFEALAAVPRSVEDDGIEALAWPIRPVALAEAVTGIRTVELDGDDFSEVGVGSHVLLVEDNEVNQVVLRSMLERCGCRVDVAGGGREAITRVQTTRYDVVLLDCHMPDLDGYATVQAIRALGHDATRLPVVALTASVLPDEPERCRAAGMNDYLAKPVGHAQLAATLRRWFGATNATTPSVERAPATEPSTAETPVVFDEHGTLARLGGNVGILLRVIRLYQRDVHSILDRLQQSAATGDLDDVRETAHRLKGSLGSLGGHAARVRVARLEDFAKDGLADDVRRELPDIEAELRRLDDALRSVVDTLG